MTEKKIVYLLGAGASAQAIPMVSQLNIRLKIFQIFLENYISPGKSGIVHDLKDLIEKEKEHYSIDTYARKLALQNNDDLLRKLKALLGCFFFFEQCTKGESIKNEIKVIADRWNNEKKIFINEYTVNAKVDKRYDAFFAATLKRTNDISLINPQVPSQINIISWNYDNQFEISLDEFLDKESNEEYPLWFMSNMADKGLENYEKTMLIRLNGAAVYQHDWGSFTEVPDGIKLFDYEIDKYNADIFQTIYKNLIENKSPLIQFAWDTDLEIDNRIRYANKLISEADAVVVIGYSFPYYNLRIDQSIFKNINSKAKVYLQAPKDSITDIKSRLTYMGMAGDSDKIELIDSIDLFFLPPEYFGISTLKPQPIRAFTRR